METYIPRSLDEIAELFFRHKKYFFVPFFGVLVLAAVAFRILPKSYEAEAILITDAGSIANPLERERETQGTLVNRIKQLNLMVLSFSNINTMLTNLGYIIPGEDQKMIDAQVVRVKKKSLVEIQPNGFVLVKYEDPVAERAYQITKAIAEEMVKKDRELYESEASHRVEFIHEQLRIYKEKLESSETSYLTRQLNADLNEAIRKREVLMGQTVLGPSKIQMELAQTEADLKKLLVDATPEHPMVGELNNKIARLRRALTSNINQSSADASMDNPAYQQAYLKRSEAVKEIDLEIAAIRKKIQSLQRTGQAGQSGSEQELAANARDKKVNEDIYQALLMGLANATIAQKLGSRGKKDMLEILDPPLMPTAFSKPNPFIIGAAGFIFAIVAGLLVIFLREYFDSSFRTVRDAREYLEIPLLGHIPVIENTKKNNVEKTPSGTNGHQNGKSTGMTVSFGPKIVAYHQPDSKASEHFRLLRTNLESCQVEHPFTTLLLSSALEGEGKSTTLLNLGVSFASETTKRVVVVDGDLRRGSLAEKIGTSATPGLMDYLLGQVQLEQILRPTGIANLSVVTSGKTVNSPSRVLTGDLLKKFVDELRSRFDLILVDSPPVLDLSDVPILSSLMDGILFVVQAGKTRREQVLAMNTIMHQFKRTKVLGYVLTQVESKLPTYLNPYLPTGY